MNTNEVNTIIRWLVGVITIGAVCTITILFLSDRMTHVAMLNLHKTVLEVQATVGRDDARITELLNQIHRLQIEVNNYAASNSKPK